MANVPEFDGDKHPRAHDGKFRDVPLKGDDAVKALEATHVDPVGDQTDALATWSTSRFIPVQALLRGHSSLPIDPAKLEARREEYTKVAGDLDGLIHAQKPLDHSVETWRGLDTSGIPEDALGAMQPGRTLVDPGFSSVSTDFTQARFFGGTETVMLRVRMPKGSQSYWRGDNEQEAILPRNARFKVLTRQEDVDFGASRKGVLLDVELEN